MPLETCSGMPSSAGKPCAFCKEASIFRNKFVPALTYAWGKLSGKDLTALVGWT